MKIIHTPHYDFHNVLIRPKRTTISSRSQVDLEREMTFKYSPQKWKGVPIISANMDTTGTFEVYDVLSKHKMITCLSKFYSLKDLLDPCIILKTLQILLVKLILNHLVKYDILYMIRI